MSDVTIESLQSSLDDLVKAADAVDLLKGGSVDSNRVESSGTHGSDGEQGGGRGTTAAKIDDMMIGKLAGLGFDAGQISSMLGSLTGKAAEEADDEEEEAMKGYLQKLQGKAREHFRMHGSMKGFEGLPYAKSGGDAGEPLVKSLDQFREDPDIASAIDVSPYLEAMTSRTAEQIDGMTRQLSKGFRNQANVNRALAGALHQMGTLAKSQAVVISELGKRLGMVEREPRPQRGVTTAAALNKSMPGEAGTGGGKQLSKSELLNTLSYMNLEKGMRHINGQPTSQAIGLLEGGGVVSADVVKAAHDFHTSHPNESDLARRYQ